MTYMREGYTSYKYRPYGAEDRKKAFVENMMKNRKKSLDKS